MISEHSCSNCGHSSCPPNPADSPLGDSFDCVRIVSAFWGYQRPVTATTGHGDWGDRLL